MPTKLAGFFHICLIHNWRQVHDEMMWALHDCGILDNPDLDAVYLGVLGTDEFPVPTHPKIKIGYRSDNIKEYEIATSHLLEKYCKENPTSRCFLIHNAGVTSNGQDPRYPWLRYMEVYHTFYRHKEAISLLGTHNVVGFDIQETPVKHVSGTCYWVRADYVNQLIPLDEARRIFPDGIGGRYETNHHSVEFWNAYCQNHGNWYSFFQPNRHWSDPDRVRVMREHLQGLPEEEKYWLKYEAQKCLVNS